MRAEEIVGGAEGVLGADDFWKCFVEEVHARAEVGDLVVRGGAKIDHKSARERRFVAE